MIHDTIETISRQFATGRGIETGTDMQIVFCLFLKFVTGEQLHLMFSRQTDYLNMFSA